ncbi:MAG: bifunctional phosphopantothenoylcysteine decarboxylase/phosphopantothenate--cysteine ligase CoaBC [Gammaproteobacteria bacterium]
MTPLKGKKIILSVTGSIAAYKAAEIARLLLKQNAEIRVIMTPGAQQFITPLTFQAIVGNQVFTDLFNPTHAAMEHIDLARWADYILIAPASASSIARLTYGFADDLLSTTCLAAANVPIFIAPAMNQQMWHHPVTQDNIKKLQQQGVRILGPASGEQACGDVGLGRMLEPEEILEQLTNQISNKLIGLRVLITAGPTREAIDAVRFISNHSSGKMGYALAQAFHNQGANVTLISGPCTIPPPSVAKFVAVTSAAEMLTSVMQHANECDIFIAAAAVTDFKLEKPFSGKIKKSEKNLQLMLSNNPDILKTVTALDQPPYTVGFALEVDHLLKNAQQKLTQKKANMVIANLLQENNAFYADENEVWVLQPDREPLHISKMPKSTLAEKLCEIICNNVDNSSLAIPFES